MRQGRSRAQISSRSVVHTHRKGKRIAFPDVAPNFQRSTLNAFRILGESPDWLFVDKPPFLEVHPSKPGRGFTMWDGLRELLVYEIANGGQVSIINRLDRETSGVTLVAKTHESARRLGLEMMARRVEKEYLAITWGWPETDEFTVDAPLLRRGEREPSRIHLMQMVHPDGAVARTRFQVERRFQRASSNGERFALIRAFPEMGRTHQIRVHLAHAGLPIVGDKIYGPEEGCYLEFIATGWTPALAQKLLLPRHALHSTALRLPAVDLGAASPLPADLMGWIGESA
jgi:23S rRNA pseudouridine1911/1915/1917 synthase